MELSGIRQFSKIGGVNRNPESSEDGKIPVWNNTIKVFEYVSPSSVALNSKTVAGIVAKGDDAAAGGYFWALDSSKNPAWRKQDFLVSAAKSGNSIILTMNNSAAKTIPLGALAWENSAPLGVALPGNTKVLFDDGGTLSGDTTFIFEKSSKLLSLYRLLIAQELKIGTFNGANTPSWGMMQFVPTGVAGEYKPQFYSGSGWIDFASGENNYLVSITKATADVGTTSNSYKLTFTRNGLADLTIQLGANAFNSTVIPSALPTTTAGRIQFSSGNIGDGNRGFTQSESLAWLEAAKKLYLAGCLELGTTVLGDPVIGDIRFDGNHFYGYGRNDENTANEWRLLDPPASTFGDFTPIILPSASTVAGRLVGLTEGVNYPTGWILTPDGNDLIVTHGQDKHTKDVQVWSKNTLESINRKELGNAAYSGLYEPIGARFDSVVIESLATIEAEIRIYITFE